ncbi:hypothetical protein D5018_08570 [Parashewanella curva]|uniref:Uncharacterized protein n=1 Tax=Parashewanella curva TaxID=2338552 RepID=A0A3L8PX77_9GAMM|nr:hypothetical protein [Parashewanella curva]RLV60067.1 hypothetical protein D5018_08570 [Parashewanella curva]
MAIKEAQPCLAWNNDQYLQPDGITITWLKERNKEIQSLDKSTTLSILIEDDGISLPNRFKIERGLSGEFECFHETVKGLGKGWEPTKQSNELLTLIKKYQFEFSGTETSKVLRRRTSSLASFVVSEYGSSCNLSETDGSETSLDNRVGKLEEQMPIIDIEDLGGNVQGLIMKRDKP